MGPHLPGLTLAAQESWKNTRMLTVGGVGNGAAKEDGRWDLNLGAAAIKRENHDVLKQVDR